MGGEGHVSLESVGPSGSVERGGPRSRGADGLVWLPILAALALPVAVLAANVPFGPPQIIATSDTLIGTFVAAADVDGDGDPDLVWAGGDYLPSIPGGIVWFENTDGHGSWGPAQTIASATGTYPGFAVADLDGDGDPDVVAGDTWYENAAGDGSSWVAHSGGSGGYAAWAADLDGDGDVDLLDGGVGWAENDGGSPPGWIGHTIGASGAYGPVAALLAADLDGDHDLDAVSYAPPFPCGSMCAEPDAARWFANDGGSPPSWTPHDLPQAWLSCYGATQALLRAEDMDGDGDLDLFVSCWTNDISSRGSGWFESDGAPVPSFTFHPIESAPAFPFDLDGDGDVDMLAPNTPLPAISWLESDGGAPPTFTPHVIDRGNFLATAYAPVDVDGDGDTDLVANVPRSEGWALIWYENLSVRPPVPALPGAGGLLLAATLVAGARARLRARTGRGRRRRRL